MTTYVCAQAETQRGSVSRSSIIFVFKSHCLTANLDKEVNAEFFWGESDLSLKTACATAGDIQWERKAGAEALMQTVKWALYKQDFMLRNLTTPFLTGVCIKIWLNVQKYIWICPLSSRSVFYGVMKPVDQQCVWHKKATTWKCKSAKCQQLNTRVIGILNGPLLTIWSQSSVHKLRLGNHWNKTRAQFYP